MVFVNLDFVERFFVKRASFFFFTSVTHFLFQMSLHFQNIMLYTWLIIINTSFWIYEEVVHEDKGMLQIVLLNQKN